MAPNNFVELTLNHKFPFFFTNKTERGFSGQSMEYSNEKIYRRFRVKAE